MSKVAVSLSPSYFPFLPLSLSLCRFERVAKLPLRCWHSLSSSAFVFCLITSSFSGFTTGKCPRPCSRSCGIYDKDAADADAGPAGV